MSHSSGQKFPSPSRPGGQFFYQFFEHSPNRRIPNRTRSVRNRCSPRDSRPLLKRCLSPVPLTRIVRIFGFLVSNDLGYAV